MIRENLDLQQTLVWYLYALSVHAIRLEKKPDRKMIGLLEFVRLHKYFNYATIYLVDDLASPGVGMTFAFAFRKQRRKVFEKIALGLGKSIF